MEDKDKIIDNCRCLINARLDNGFTETFKLESILLDYDLVVALAVQSILNLMGI